MIINVKSKFKFKCIRCGKCCSTGPNVALTVYDVVRISKYLEVKPRDALSVYMKVIVADYTPFIALAGDKSGKCVFLGYSDKGTPYCKVYKARPMRCRLYPVIPVSPSSSVVELSKNCPGVGLNRDASIPPALIKQYFWEVKTHYTVLTELVFSRGYGPLEALYELLNNAYNEALNGALWCNIDYIDSLGAT